MAKIVTFGFRLASVADLSDTSKGNVALEQINEISQDGSQEIDDVFYEDSEVPSWKLRKNLTGNITIKGDLEDYIYPSYDTETETLPLFEFDHYYLLTFLRLNKRVGVSKMVYCRWIGQYVERTKETLAAASLNPKEVILAITMFGTVAFLPNAFYEATVITTDPTPQADYDPLFSAIVSDSTKTISAAEDHIKTGLVNPAA